MIPQISQEAADIIHPLKICFLISFDLLFNGIQLFLVTFQKEQVLLDDLFQKIIDESLETWHAPFFCADDPLQDPQDRVPGIDKHDPLLIQRKSEFPVFPGHVSPVRDRE